MNNADNFFKGKSLFEILDNDRLAEELMDYLQKNDKIIKISKNKIPFISKVTRDGEAQIAFAKKYRRYDGMSISDRDQFIDMVSGGFLEIGKDNIKYARDLTGDFNKSRKLGDLISAIIYINKAICYLESLFILSSNLGSETGFRVKDKAEILLKEAKELQWQIEQRYGGIRDCKI
jgi:hypothetical protein